ncbi:Methylmalonyl-CoA carboxyltransferase 12S subunit [Corynebacterium faecale]|uniref:hypothetical protein n=1 Tax=Corynebacterium faecale TaxID=1758466 RepID=UPI0025B5F5AF|nr:hypothetical protein [Corynebacterium faecale]WJY91546.1 Methylmalonyl-CoA carboxyltransferase 12S subunit [Corynebacterium faecale]
MDQQQLQELVDKLSQRLDTVEAELKELRARSDADIPEDILMAISAAVSAYLGNRGKVKAVKLHRHRTWAAQGRQRVQDHSNRL